MSDGFFAFSFKPCVNNEQHHSRSDGSQFVPSLLVIKKRLKLCQGVGIFEDENGSLEADIMLQQVSLVLDVVPFKTHGRVPAPQLVLRIPGNH